MNANYVEIIFISHLFQLLNRLHLSVEFYTVCACSVYTSQPGTSMFVLEELCGSSLR